MIAKTSGKVIVKAAVLASTECSARNHGPAATGDLVAMAAAYRPILPQFIPCATRTLAVPLNEFFSRNLGGTLFVSHSLTSYVRLSHVPLSLPTVREVRTVRTCLCHYHPLGAPLALWECSVACYSFCYRNPGVFWRNWVYLSRGDLKIGELEWLPD